MVCKLLKSLASIARSAHGLSIFEEGWPVKTRLQDLHGCLL